jgi:hypothetical protein
VLLNFPTIIPTVELSSATRPAQSGPGPCYHRERDRG